MNNAKFKKVILTNMIVAFLYGIIICPLIAIIFYALSTLGPGHAEPASMSGLYPVIRFGLIVGAAFGFIFAVILGMLFRPFKSAVFFKNEDNFLSVLNIAINRINYELDKRDSNLYVFREKRNRLASISVRIKDNNAVIYGHFNKVTYLKKYLLNQSPFNIK